MKVASNKKKPVYLKRYFSLALLLLFVFGSCTFDYGQDDGQLANRPDIVMENLEYSRVRGGYLLARFSADHAEQWEERQVMELRDFTFQQMEDRGETINVEGHAGAAEVHLESGDIVLFDGVNIRIESEDITINTIGIEWHDNERALIGHEEEEVEVLRSDGTNFIGRGFSADVRRRTWTFSGEAWGSFVDEDEED